MASPANVHKSYEKRPARALISIDVYLLDTDVLWICDVFVDVLFDVPLDSNALEKLV